MSSAERESILKSFDAAGARLQAAVSGLSPEQFAYSPAPGAWSVSGILEHLIVMENRVLGRLQAVLQAPPDPAKQSALKDEQAFYESVRRRGSRIEAPPIVHPEGRWTGAAAVAELEAARARTRAFAAATDTGLRDHFLTHPLFGEIDCAQWLFLIPAHCERHCAQIEELKASPAFPPSPKSLS